MKLIYPNWFNRVANLLCSLIAGTTTAIFLIVLFDTRKCFLDFYIHIIAQLGFITVVYLIAFIFVLVQNLGTKKDGVNH